MKEYFYIATEKEVRKKGLDWFSYGDTIVNKDNEIVAYWSEQGFNKDTKFYIPLMLYEFTLKWLSEIYIYAKNSDLAVSLFLKEYSEEDLIGMRRFEKVEDINFNNLI